MRIFSCFLLVTVLCLLSNIDCAGQEKPRKKRMATAVILKIATIIPKAVKFFKGIAKLSKFIHGQKEPEKKEPQILGHLITMSSQITKMEVEIKNHIDDAVRTILKTFPKLIKLENALHDLTLITNQIDFAEEQMQNYLILGYKNSTKRRSNGRVKIRRSLSNETTNLKNETKSENEFDFGNETEVLGEISDILKRHKNTNRLRDIEKFTLLDFATWATSHSFNSLLSLLRRMNDLVVKNNDRLFDLIFEVSKRVGENPCSLKHAPQQHLYNLYYKIAMAELKGNYILQFAFMILNMYRKGTFIDESQLSLQTYEKYTIEKMEAVSEVLAKTERSIYKCDPHKYVEGETYTKFIRLLQGYIENETDLNPGNSCKKTCGDYSYGRSRGCFKRKFCAKQPRCAGVVVGCYTAERKMKVCRSSSSERRYDYIEYKSGKVFGRKGHCSNGLYKVEDWRRWFVKCSYCICTCDDDGSDSQRHISLRSVTSDIKNNKVVTGVRIVKKKKVIHFQIQQGVLNPVGFIDRKTISWKPVDEFTIHDKNVHKNKDYYKLSYYWRYLRTDQLHGPPEHAVTGVRFASIGDYVAPEIQMTRINFATGEVFQNSSYWLRSKSKSEPTEIHINSPDIPTRHGPHRLNSKHNQYFRFAATTMDADAAQTTIPFVDSQPLTSEGFLISGLGLIHRGKWGSGGFLAPLLTSYDYAAHLRINENS